MSGQSDRGKWIRAAWIAVAVATVLRVWLAPAMWESQAQAQIPDGGMQRKQLIDEVRRTNALLTEIRDAIVGKHEAIPEKPGS